MPKLAQSLVWLHTRRQKVTLLPITHPYDGFSAVQSAVLPQAAEQKLLLGVFCSNWMHRLLLQSPFAVQPVSPNFFCCGASMHLPLVHATPLQQSAGLEQLPPTG